MWRLQVLHGCRQFVLWNVGLISLTNETPLFIQNSVSLSLIFNKNTAGDKLEEGRDHVKSSWPLWAGQHTCYNGEYKEKQWWESEQISKNLPQFRLFSATREHEAGITSNRGSARHGEYVPEPCTPRPSLVWSLEWRKSLSDKKEIQKLTLLLFAFWMKSWI